MFRRINITAFSGMTWLSLVIFWLAYGILGWYLSAHHVVWVFSALIAAVILAAVWKSSPLLEMIWRFFSQKLSIVLVGTLILSISLAFIATWSLLSVILFMPLATTVLANLELRFVGFNERDSLLSLTAIAGLGLFLGEAVDLIVLPSMRY